MLEVTVSWKEQSLSNCFRRDREVILKLIGEEQYSLKKALFGLKVQMLLRIPIEITPERNKNGCLEGARRRRRTRRSSRFY